MKTIIKILSLTSICSAIFLINSCAYTEAMDTRTAETKRLEQEQAKVNAQRLELERKRAALQKTKNNL